MRNPANRAKPERDTDMMVSATTRVGEKAAMRAMKDWLSNRDSRMMSKNIKNLSGFAWKPTNQYTGILYVERE